MILTASCQCVQKLQNSPEIHFFYQMTVSSCETCPLFVCADMQALLEMAHLQSDKVKVLTREWCIVEKLMCLKLFSGVIRGSPLAKPNLDRKMTISIYLSAAVHLHSKSGGAEISFSEAFNLPEGLLTYICL